MTPAEQEATFIALWTQGLEIAVMAQRLGIPKGTVQSRAHGLQQRGLIQPRPKGGAYPRRKALARQEGTPATPTAPAPPAGERRNVVQWTVRLSSALIEDLKQMAYEERLNPSELVERLVRQALSAMTSPMEPSDRLEAQ